MKFFVVISFAVIMLGLASCGEDAQEEAGKPTVDSTEEPLPVRITAKQRIARRERRTVAKAEHSKPQAITIARPHGAPPTHLIVRDLRKGTGAPVTPSDAIVVSYFSTTYENALKESETGRYGPSRFGMIEVIKGWALGLPGMRVGGRRELIVPKRLGYEGFIGIYVIDLLAVERNGAAGF
jgi:peptidylprolyl isomerase